jgi:hypothetical protein
MTAPRACAVEPTGDSQSAENASRFLSSLGADEFHRDTFPLLGGFFYLAPGCKRARPNAVMSESPGAGGLHCSALQFVKGYLVPCNRVQKSGGYFEGQRGRHDRGDSQSAENASRFLSSLGACEFR